MSQRFALLAFGCSAVVGVATAAASLAALTVSATAVAQEAEPAAAPPAEPAAPESPAASPATTPSPAPASAAPSPPKSAEDTLIALGRDLELVVTEMGPDQPWTLHLTNRGTTPMGVMADPGLLWFEISAPGAASQTCRLPEPLWPKAMRRRAEVVLAPGERFSRRFDPRFFCFAELAQTALVPNARVIPHFGWPHDMRTATVGGKRVEQPLTPRPPFIAWAVSEGTPSAPDGEGEPVESDEQGESASELPRQLPNEGLKNITGSALVLPATYAKWSDRAPPLDPGLNVALLAGADAEDERSAQVTVAIGNAGAAVQTLVVRRELISFDVLGPDGPFECPTGEMGQPDVASFTSFGPRGTEQLVVRLIEMCPRGSFSRPGLYEVWATWHSKFSGQALGIDAFVGTLKSPRPAQVRVRSGERAAFIRTAPMVGNGDPVVGAPVPAQAPTEAPPPDNVVGPEAPVQESAPQDTTGPEEVPAPLPVPDPPAPDGTSVE